MTSLVKPFAALFGGRPSAPPEAAVAAPTFERVYAECFDVVWRALRRLGVADAQVADAAQDVFLRVHCHLPTFEGRSTVRSWVFGIAVNVAREHRRRNARQRTEALPEEPVADGAPDAFQAVACGEALALLDHLLDRLDDDRRAVLVLAEWEEMTAPEIAAALGVNVNTVYTRLRAARADFDAALARHHGRAR